MRLHQAQHIRVLLHHIEEIWRINSEKTTKNKNKQDDIASFITLHDKSSHFEPNDKQTIMVFDDEIATNYFRK